LMLGGVASYPSITVPGGVFQSGSIFGFDICITGVLFRDPSGNTTNNNT
jgi:hypothetical protein